MEKNGTKLMYDKGTEGPSCDPYSYEEFTVIKDGIKVTLHLGLTEWLEINGKKNSNVYERDIDLKVKFEELTGMNVNQFMKYYDVIHNSCKNCGCRDTRCMSGYPSETLNVCTRCGEIVSADINMRTIM